MSLSLTVEPEVVEITVDLSNTGLTVSPSPVEIAVSGDSVDLTVEPNEMSLTVSNTLVGIVVNAATVEIVTAAEQGPAGVDGADATGQRSFAFAWGDATPVPLLTVDAGRMVLACTVSLDVPFDGVGSSLSIGDAGDDGSIFDASMIDTSVVGSFQNSPCLRFGADTEVLLTITPGTGASTGSGVVSLFLE